MLKIIAIIVIIAFIGYGAFCCFAILNPQTGLPDMPGQGEAQYSVRIKNTGGMLLTDDYELHGDTTGARVYVLHGFWEMSGKDFKFRDRDVILDEAIFGEITIKRR